MAEHGELTGGAHIGGPFVVRVAGLPSASLRALRFTESYAVVDELVTTQRWLASEGTVLAELLHPVIGQLAGATGKPALVGLRRSLHRARRPKAREWCDEVAAALPADVTCRVRAWVARHEAAAALSTGLPAVLAAESRRQESVLREVSADPRFRRALSHASEALSGELGKWLADPRHRPQRRSQLQLARYVARAAAKTSPYSTFTIVGTGEWDVTGEPGLRADVPVRSVAELNGLLLQRVLHALYGRPEVAAALRYRVNPSATTIGDKVSFLGPSGREPIVALPEVPAVRRCRELLEASDGLPLAELCTGLARDSGDAGRAEAFVGQLVRAGLLEPVLPVPEQSPDPLADLADWLGAHGGAALSDACVALHAVRTELFRAVPVSDVDGSVAHRAALDAAIRRLCTAAGLDTGSPATAAKDLFCENASYPEPVLRVPQDRFRQALEDLDVTRRALAVLDPGLPLRTALGEFVAQRFGPGARIPFLALHQAVAGELSDAASVFGPELAVLLGGVTGTGELRTSALPRLRELAAWQDELDALLRPAGPMVRRAEPAMLSELAARLPGWITTPESVGYYVQPVSDMDGHRLVVNAAHGGHGRGRGRAVHLIRQAGGQCADLGEIARHDGILAELGGMYAFAPNVRAPSVGYEIDYPFTAAGRAAQRRLRLGELYAEHDVHTGLVRLSAPRLGAAVVPLHLGMMADGLLPPAARLLTQAFGPTYYVHPSRPLLLRPEQFAMADDAAVPVPRLEIGRVVLQRARWVVPRHRVPVRGPGDTDASHFTAMVTWLRDNGIPERCFVRLWVEEPGDAGGPSAKWLVDKSRKPVYVDFANWYLVQAFERMLAAPGPVLVFEEALPTVDDVVGGAEPRVIECLIELSGKEISHA